PALVLDLDVEEAVPAIARHRHQGLPAGHDDVAPEHVLLPGVVRVLRDVDVEDGIVAVVADDEVLLAGLGRHGPDRRRQRDGGGRETAAHDGCFLEVAWPPRGGMAEDAQSGGFPPHQYRMLAVPWGTPGPGGAARSPAAATAAASD